LSAVAALQEWIPSGIKIDVLADRTQTIRASIHDIQRTLAISVLLVMMSSTYFCAVRRRSQPPASPCLSLVGTCAAMWARFLAR
jgi:multidrug efflux pump